MAALILVVEDELDLARTIEYNLRQEKFATRVAHSGDSALKLAQQAPLPDLVLLDVMLPDISGVEVCRRLKTDAKTKGIPVVMLTAKGEEIDRVVGFEVGADDYVVKPFSVRELVLRIRAVLRRREDPTAEHNELVAGAIRVALDAHRAEVHGHEVELTALEFRLLCTLMERKGRVQTRDRLLNDVWGIHAEVTTRTVDTHVKRLRQKLGDAGGYIETLRGVGYRWRAEEEGT